MISEEEYLQQRKEDRKEPRDRFFTIRQVLNICFILTAIVGVAIYLLSDRTVGLYVVFLAMAIKFSESALRMMK
jgi:hypothetical protein